MGGTGRKKEQFNIAYAEKFQDTASLLQYEQCCQQFKEKVKLQLFWHVFPYKFRTQQNVDNVVRVPCKLEAYNLSEKDTTAWCDFESWRKRISDDKEKQKNNNMPANRVRGSVTKKQKRTKK